MKKKFIRSDYMRYSKLGKNRKKLQKWRRPKGRHSKMRERREGYPTRPNVGHKRNKKEKGKIEGKYPLLVYNTKDLKKAGKENVIILGRVGAKKKIEIVKIAEEMKLKIINSYKGKGEKNATN